MKKLTLTLLLAMLAMFSTQAAKVYLKVSDFVTSSSAINAYAWYGSDSQLLGGWPGTAMTLEQVGYANYYVCEFDYDGEYSIIFSGNVYDKNQQTVNLTGNVGDCTFAANGNWSDGKWHCAKTEGAPSTEYVPTVQIAGLFNEWNKVDMTAEADGTFTYEVEQNVDKLTDNAGFCIIVDGDYYGKQTLELGDEAKVMGANPNDDNLKISGIGDYHSVVVTVSFDTEGWKVKAEGHKTSGVTGVGAENATIAAADGEIVVEGAKNVAVYTTSGALVSTDARTNVAAGIYIVRADNVVKKVVVK